MKSEILLTGDELLNDKAIDALKNTQLRMALAIRMGVSYDTMGRMRKRLLDKDADAHKKFLFIEILQMISTSASVPVENLIYIPENQNA